MATLSSTTLRNALISYRSELLQLQAKFPQVYKTAADNLVLRIDQVLYEIEGNITEVEVSPVACKVNV